MVLIFFETLTNLAIAIRVKNAHDFSMSNSPSPISEIVTELKNRGYKAQQQGNGVFFEVNPDLGECLSYAIEFVLGKWQVNATKVAFDGSGDDNEEHYILGDYDTATEIANAIDEDDK